MRKAIQNAVLQLTLEHPEFESFGTTSGEHTRFTITEQLVTEVALLAMAAGQEFLSFDLIDLPDDHVVFVHNFETALRIEVLPNNKQTDRYWAKLHKQRAFSSALRRIANAYDQD